MENVLHLVHLCQFSRMCHYTGPLALKSSTLPQMFSQVLQFLDLALDDDQWTCYANSMWAIWRCRNEVMYAGKGVDLGSFQKYLGAITWES